MNPQSGHSGAKTETRCAPRHAYVCAPFSLVDLWEPSQSQSGVWGLGEAGLAWEFWGPNGCGGGGRKREVKPLPPEMWSRGTLVVPHWWDPGASVWAEGSGSTCRYRHDLSRVPTGGHRKVLAAMGHPGPGILPPRTGNNICWPCPPLSRGQVFLPNLSLCQYHLSLLLILPAQPLHQPARIASK